MAEIMSERLREQLAQRLGVSHLVQGDYWGHVPARECGALVREAIRVAEQALVGQTHPATGAAQQLPAAGPASRWTPPQHLRAQQAPWQ